jgi:hypothetical protein
MVLVTTLTRNEDNTNRFMQGVWFKNCGQGWYTNIKDEQNIWVECTCSSVLQCTCHQSNHPQRWTMLTIQEAVVLVQVYSNVLATNAKQGESYSKSLVTKLECRIDSKCQFCPDKRTWFFSHNTTWLSRHGWDKFCGFIHYNVQYVMYIVA